MIVPLETKMNSLCKIGKKRTQKEFQFFFWPKGFRIK